MSKNVNIITIDGEDYAEIYSKTRKGKAHPTGGTYRFLIPLYDYKPRNRK